MDMLDIMSTDSYMREGIKMSIPIGEKCSCGKKHFVKSEEIWNSLNPKDKLRAYSTTHRIFSDGYERSLSMNNDTEIWEWYSALSIAKLLIIEGKEEKEEEKEHCLSCGKEISKEESKTNLGYCSQCFYMEEFQDADDL